MSTDIRKLITLDEVNKLQIADVWKLYSDFISESQVALLGRFRAGRSLVRSAQGSSIFLDDGTAILDLTGGIGVLNHGHNHPEIIEARQEFSKSSRMEVHKNFLSPYLAALSHNMAQLLPSDLNISYFPNSGSEAVEGSVKMAYKFHNGDRKKILVSDLSFHGKLLGAGSLTRSPEQHFSFPKITGVVEYRFNDLDSVRSAVLANLRPDGSSDIYALLVEPLNVSSMTSADGAFLEGLRNICDEFGIILIVDEVYSGWAKTGELFNFMRIPQFVPDIVVYAKSFGGGKASIAGYTAREKIARSAYDNLQDATLHSTTYNGFGEETATALKAVEIIVRDDYVAKSKEIGEEFWTGVRDLRSSPMFEDISGSGALWGFHLRSPQMAPLIRSLGRFYPDNLLKDTGFLDKLVAASAVHFLLEKHNVLTYFGSNYRKPLIVSFPLVASSADVSKGIEALQGLSRQNPDKLVLEFVVSANLKRPKLRKHTNG